MMWSSMCWNSVFPGKTQDIYHCRVCRDIYWQNSRSWPFPLLSASLALRKKKTHRFQGQQKVWADLVGRMYVEKGEKVTGLTQGNIKLLHSTSQGKVSLAEQPWLQNHSRHARALASGGTSGACWAHYESPPFQHYSWISLLLIWPCAWRKQASGLDPAPPQSSPALALGTAMRFSCSFFPLPQQ